MKTNNTKLNLPQKASIIRDNLMWTDITSPSPGEIDYLAQTHSFHPLALEDALSRTQLSKVDDYGNYLFLVLHLPVLIPGDQIIKSTWLSVFIGSNYIITLHDPALRTLTDLFHECQMNEATQNTYFSDGSGYLLYLIIDRLIESIFPILNRLLTMMDDIEDNVFDADRADTKDIVTLRRDIITLRRIIWPARSVVHVLNIKIKPFTSSDLGIYFDNLLDQVNKIWDNLEEAKEVIEVYKDTDFVLATNRINRVGQILTIISSILLPFLIISSIYGMNINLPGGLQRGDLTTFAVLLAVMLLISGGMLYFMHRRRWI